MKILAIDTSTKFLSVCVSDKSDILAGFRDKGKLQHSSALIPAIDRTLKKAKLKLKNIEAIALSIGPGSFTGLRIGVATVKGINLALGIPIAGVPTLDAIAYNFIDEKRSILCPVIDAKKNKVYASLYSGTKRISDYMLTDIDSLVRRINKPALVFGDGAGLYGDHCKKNPMVSISTKNWLPRAEIVAKLGFEKAMKRKFTNPDRLVPMYLHSQYCQIQKVKA